MSIEPALLIEGQPGVYSSIPRLILASAGVKHGLGNLPYADLYLDCRVIPNPFHNQELSGRTGADPLVQSWVEEHAATEIRSFIDQIVAAVKRTPARRRNRSDPFKEPIKVCCLCAWGVHRSVAMKHLLARMIPDVVAPAQVTVV